jgi:hypothetical protein
MPAETAARATAARSPAAVTRADEPPAPPGAAVREAAPPPKRADAGAARADPPEREDARPPLVGDPTPPASARTRTIPADVVVAASPAPPPPAPAVPGRSSAVALVSASSGGPVRMDRPAEGAQLPAPEQEPIRWRAPRVANDPAAVGPPRPAPISSTAVTSRRAEAAEIPTSAPATPTTRPISAEAGLEVPASAARAQPLPRLGPWDNPLREDAGSDASRVHIGSIEVQVVQPPSSPPAPPPRADPGAGRRSSARTPAVGSLSRGFRSFGLTQG